MLTFFKSVDEIVVDIAPPDMHSKTTIVIANPKYSVFFISLICFSSLKLQCILYLVLNFM